jgi:hypothetical protein
MKRSGSFSLKKNVSPGEPDILWAKMNRLRQPLLVKRGRGLTSKCVFF